MIGLVVGGAMVALGTQGWALVLGSALAGGSTSVKQLVGRTHRAPAVSEHFRARLASVSILVMKLVALLRQALAGVALGMIEVSTVYTRFGLSLSLVTLAFPLLPGIQQCLARHRGAVTGWCGR